MPKRYCSEINGSNCDHREARCRLHGIERRRLDRLRLLDLLRAATRTASTRPARRKPASRADLGGVRMGLGVAAQPAHAVQPRFRRSRRPALVRAKEVCLVGRGEAEWTGFDVPDFIKDRPPSYRPPRTRKGIDTHQRHRSVHHECRRQVVDLRSQGLQDGPLPTHYEPQESVIQNPLYGQQCNPRAHGMDAARKSVSSGLGRSAIPVHADHLPADRASHRGRHVALAVLAFRTAAGDVLRSLAGAGRGKGSEEWRLGDHPHRARGRSRRACW